MKIRNAEQYRKWQEDKQRRRKPKTKAARRAVQKVRKSDLLESFVGVVAYGFDLPLGDYRRKPNHKARAVRIEDAFSKSAIGCPQKRKLETHYSHPMPTGGMCPGYMRVREDEQYG